MSKKRVSFKSNDYFVEEWVRFITLDDDGSVWVWQNKPFKHDGVYSCLLGDREWIDMISDENCVEV